MSAESETVESVPVPSVSPAVAINRSTRAAITAEAHRLTYKWVMWCSRAQINYDCKEVTDFETVEQFWSLFNYLDEEKDRIFSHYGDFCFFRDGIKPDWDDEHHKDGGRVVVLDPACTNSEILMRYIRTICLLMVGHQFEDAAEHVFGLFASRSKTQWTVALWLDNNSPKTRHKVCVKICDEMDLPPNVEVKWYSHANKKKFINLRNPKKKGTSSEDSTKKDDDSAAAPADD